MLFRSDPETTFRLVEEPFNLKPADDEALVKVEYLSLDPAMRLWLAEQPAGPSMPTLPIGATMLAIGLGTVVEAGANSGVAVGDNVSGYVGRYCSWATLYCSADVIILTQV